MQRQNTKVVAPDQSEKGAGKTAKIEAISGSGSIKVALKSQAAGTSGNVQSIEVERQAKAKANVKARAEAQADSGAQLTDEASNVSAPDAQATVTRATDTQALPFPKKARIHLSPEPQQQGTAASTGKPMAKSGSSKSGSAELKTRAATAAATVRSPNGQSSKQLMTYAAAAIAVVVIGLVGLQFVGSEKVSAEAPAPTPTEAPTQSAAETSEATAATASTAAAPATETAVAAQETKTLSASDQMIAKMTAGTLAALRSHATAAADDTATAAVAPADAAAVSQLYQLVISAVSQGQSEAYIDQLVNEAYANKTIAVPEGLIRADGRVDTQTILSLFIAK